MNVLLNGLDLCVGNYIYSMTSSRRHAPMNHTTKSFIIQNQTITVRLNAKSLTLSHKITLISTWADEGVWDFTSRWCSCSCDPDCVCVWLSAWEGTTVLPYMVGWGSTSCPTLFPVDCSPIRSATVPVEEGEQLLASPAGQMHNGKSWKKFVHESYSGQKLVGSELHSVLTVVY